MIIFKTQYQLWVFVVSCTCVTKCFELIHMKIKINRTHTHVKHALNWICIGCDYLNQLNLNG